MYRQTDRHSQAGFSLVEVLCALAIAAGAIAIMTSAIGVSLKGTAALDQRLGGRIILQSILDDELAASGTAPAQREGNSGPYAWQLDITADDGKDLPPPYRMYRLAATVSWGAGGKISGTVLKLAR